MIVIFGTFIFLAVLIVIIANVVDHGDKNNGEVPKKENKKFDISGYTRVNEDVYEYEVTQDEDKDVRDICSIVQPRDRVDIRLLKLSSENEYNFYFMNKSGRVFCYCSRREHPVLDKRCMDIDRTYVVERCQERIKMITYFVDHIKFPGKKANVIDEDIKNMLEDEESENKAKKELAEMEDEYDTIDFELAGLYYRSETARYDARSIKLGEEVTLSRNPSNKYDPYAVKVKSLLGRHIGFVPQDLSKEVTKRFKDIEDARVCHIFKTGLFNDPYITITIFFRRKDTGK